MLIKTPIYSESGSFYTLHTDACWHVTSTNSPDSIQLALYALPMKLVRDHWSPTAWEDERRELIKTERSRQRDQKNMRDVWRGKVCVRERDWVRESERDRSRDKREEIWEREDDKLRQNDWKIESEMYWSIEGVCVCRVRYSRLVRDTESVDLQLFKRLPQSDA